MAAVRIADRRQNVGAGLDIGKGRHAAELSQQSVIDMRQEHGPAEYPQLQVDGQEAAGISEGARGNSTRSARRMPLWAVSTSTPPAVGRNEVAWSAMMTASCCRATSVCARTMARGLT